MSIRYIAILLYVVLACSACGEREVGKNSSSSRGNNFQKKRICAELGSRRLALDRRKDEDEPEWVSRAVRAEWCFSTELNTCIYSSKEDVMFTPDTEAIPKVVMSVQATIDLLTNRTLITVEGVKASQAEIVEYEKKRQGLFSKCL
jgi:hypothetical protein